MLQRVRDWAEGRRGLGWLVVAVDVQIRFGLVRGSYIAAAVTLMTFLSLFPMLVFLVGVLGFVSAAAADLPGEIVAALGLRPDGDIAKQIEDAIKTAEDSRRAASIVGLAGLGWSGLGVVGAVQNAFNAVWGVQGRGIRDRLVGVAWLAGAGIAFLLSFVVTAGIALLPAFLAPLNILVSLVVSMGIWLWSARLLPNRDVGLRALVPGAILGTIGFEVLKLVGSLYVPRAVASASALYGSLGLVLAVLGWLFFFGRLLVYSAVLNVVSYERSHGTVDVTVQAPAIGAR